MQLVVTEKPSVAQAISHVIGAKERKDGYMEGNGFLVSWCVGHLVELAQPEMYSEACNYSHHRNYKDRPFRCAGGRNENLIPCR